MTLDLREQSREHLKNLPWEEGRTGTLDVLRRVADCERAERQAGRREITKDLLSQPVGNEQLTRGQVRERRQCRRRV